MAVIQRLGVRQWVLSVLQRPHYFLRYDNRAVTAVLTIFIRVVEQALRKLTPQCRTPGTTGVIRPILASVRFPYRPVTSIPNCECLLMT